MNNKRLFIGVINLVAIGLTMSVFSPMILATGEPQGEVAGDAVTKVYVGVTEPVEKPKEDDNGDDEQNQTETGSSSQGNSSNNETASNEEVLKQMIEVTRKAEVIITSNEMKGNLGNQAKIIAMDQKQDQLRIKGELLKIMNRSFVLKVLLGTDNLAVKNIENLVIQNEKRIADLNKIKSQMKVPNDIEMVQNVVKAVVQQNKSLNYLVTRERKSIGILGWFESIFIKYFEKAKPLHFWQ